MSSRKRARAHEYELGHSDRELKRLRLQARLVDPLTQQFFANAGLKPGMRVLDIGSGGGDTALLAEAIVGAEGEVVGVDQSPAAVAAAEKRIAAAGKRNISFRHGDLDRVRTRRAFRRRCRAICTHVQSRPGGDAEERRAAGSGGRPDRIS